MWEAFKDYFLGLLIVLAIGLLCGVLVVALGIAIVSFIVACMSVKFWITIGIVIVVMALVALGMAIYEKFDKEKV